MDSLLTYGSVRVRLEHISGNFLRSLDIQFLNCSNMKIRLISTFIFVVFACLIANCKQPADLSGTVFSFNLHEMGLSDSIGTLTASKFFKAEVLSVTVREDKNQLVITDGSKLIDWQKAKYLVCDLYTENNYSAIIYIDFYKKFAAPGS